MSMIGRILLATLAVLLGVAVAVAAILGVATATAHPALFLLAGLVAFALVALSGGSLAIIGLAPPRRRVWGGRIAGIVAVVAVIVGAALLLPLSPPARGATPVPGQRFWALPTGSRIAYLTIPAEGTPKPTPIIFLHGGPGVPQMAVDAPFFGQLAQDGYDVYLYDQIGAGLSARLGDPGAYTLARHVADLEAIRQQIGAARVVLIGHSWGGTVAASYLAAHPDHVERVIFSSPGALYPPDWMGAGTGMIGRLTPLQKWRAYAVLLQPRALLAYALVQVNPRAAHAFAGDREMDARFDVLFARVAPGIVCDARSLPQGEIHGLGFYANQVPQAANAPRPADPRPALRAIRAPALVLKGSCDYLPWALTMEYRDTLPDATLVYLSGVGHQAYEEQPGPYLAAVRAFLRDEPPPIAPYAPRDPPPDYTGAR